MNTCLKYEYNFHITFDQRMGKMDTFEAIFTRRSIRKFTTEMISSEELKLLLKVAMYAPSANNRQPWQFIVIRSREILNKIPEIHPYAKSLYEAPMAILVCGDEELSNQQEYWIQDCSAATQNILLAANALGLGTVWLGIHPREQRKAAIRKLFNIPDKIHPLSLIAVGYPNEKKSVSERYDPSKVHYNEW